MNDSGAGDNPVLYGALTVAVGDTPAQSGRCLLILTSGVRLELSSLPSPQWLAQVSQALAMQVR